MTTTVKEFDLFLDNRPSSGKGEGACDLYPIRIHSFMIVTSKDKRIDEIRRGVVPKRFPRDLLARAQRRIAQLDAAYTLDDLRVPPSNRLEALKGDRQGQHSIRVNDQWRLCFIWHDGNAHAVELLDYH